MRRLASLKLLVAALGLLTVINRVATSTESGTLFVGGAVERPLNLQISDLEKMPHVSVEVKDHDGNLTTYEGVPLVELLKSAGAPIGEKLRGATMASYALAEAKDGYRVVFAMPELDPALPIPRCWSRTPRTESRCPMARGRFGSWRRRRNVLPDGFACCNE